MLSVNNGGLPLFADHTQNIKGDSFAPYFEKTSISGAGVSQKVRFNSTVPPLSPVGDDRGVVSVNEAADYLGLGRSSLNRLIYNNELLSIKIGGRRLIPAVELKNYLNKAINEAREMAEKGRY